MLPAQYLGNIIAAPRWAADYFDRESLEPWPAKCRADQFTDQIGIQAIVGAAGAAASATSIPIAALTLPFTPAVSLITTGNVLIPAGTVISFGAAGSKKFAKLTADAKIGDTALTVEAIPTALVSGDTGVYSFGGGLYLPSGVLVGRTYAERDAGTDFGPADVVTPDDELFLTAFEIRNMRQDGGTAFYRHGRTVKENYLPNYTTVLAPGGTPSATLTKIRALYQCIKGVD